MSLRAKATTAQREWSSPVLLFLGLVLAYLSLSPLKFRINGYMEEEIAATTQFLEFLHLITDPESASSLVQWPRNGLLPLFIHAPFVLLSRWLFGSSPNAENAILSLQPIILTAASVVLVFLWARKLTGSGWSALGWALSAAFATMLWPYAYIGLETHQSFFLLLAGYVVLARDDVEGGLGSDLVFALSSAAAAGVKSTGMMIVPAIAYLMFHDVRARGAWRRTALGAGAMIAALVIAAYTRSFFWVTMGGTSFYLRSWLVHDPFSWLLNVVSFLTSPNKGLLIFSPVLVLAVAALPLLLARRSPLAIWTLLILAGLTGGFSLLRCWADENWGPRYLHSAVAPMVICVSAWYAEPRDWRRLKVLILTAVVVIGVGVSALGALFWYGSLHQVSIKANENILEWLHGDVEWNHIRFNGRLFRSWVSGREPAKGKWTPTRTWYFFPPPGWKAPPRIDVSTLDDLIGRPVTVPQSYAIQQMATGRQKWLWGTVLAALSVASILLLGATAVKEWRSRSAEARAAREAG